MKHEEMITRTKKAIERAKNNVKRCDDLVIKNYKIIANSLYN